ncbi:MAG: acyl-homoserine-lactone synthase [Sphingomonas sp.]|jgi:N-acyl-L-homoserine lactone synthetase|uniref:acyl-homoserine-lactone synthase n=1 Tax=Alphaproteobacteria TaxID=28211 RepID=UPI00352BA0E4
MLLATREHDALSEATAIRAMFKARKEVFVDLLGWDLPVLAGEFEVDQFDDPWADYLILTSPDGAHRASARLLHTDREHLLGGIYPYLCANAVPSGPTIREITRFCLDRHQRAGERRIARNQLVSALTDHALRNDITDYTGVADIGWFEQIQQFGWDCEPLGKPLLHGGQWLIALHIVIGDDTPDRLRQTGIYEPATLTLFATEGAMQ